MNHILDNDKKKIQQKDYFIKKFFVLLIFVILIGASFVIFSDSYNYKNESNIDKGMANQHISNEKFDDILYIQSIMNESQNRKRILSDTQINNSTDANSQQNPSISSLSNGNFVVVWEGKPQSGSTYSGINGQIFYSNGAKIGNEFIVSSYTTVDQINSKVAASSSGKFMVVWQTVSASGNNVYGQIFLNDGSKLGNQLQIIINISQWRGNPSIITLINNNFVVAWDSDTVHAQVFSDDGTLIGAQLTIDNTIGGGDAMYSSMTLLANSNYVVV